MRTAEAQGHPRPPYVIPDVRQHLYVVRMSYGVGPVAGAGPASGAKRGRQAGEGEAGLGAVWMMTGWQCGVVRFMRLTR